MKVLFYSNRKIDPIIIDASTKESASAAFMALFRYLDQEWHVYSDIELEDKIGGYISRIERKAYIGAKAGDTECAKTLLMQRQGNEYENWQLIDVINPLEPDQLPLR